jgi:hypothetical protein
MPNRRPAWCSSVFTPNRENLAKSGTKEERRHEKKNQHQTELDELEQKLNFDDDQF